MSEKQKLSQEPAFASSYDAFVGHDSLGNREYVRENNIGMSKRFYAACAAMQGILANQNGEYTVICKTNQQYAEHLISQSYQFADELLKQENL